MLKIRFIATLLIAIFINPYVICANDRDSILFATGSMNCVLRVYSDGNIEKVLYLDGPSGYGGSIYYGSDSPLISPDQRHVAIIWEDDLWIFEPDTKNLTQLTQVAKPYTEKYLSVEVKTKSWSWDSRKLFYSVSSGDPGSGDDGFDRKVRPANYGFYIYNVEDKSTKFVSESISNSTLDKLVPNFNKTLFDWSQDGTTLINGNKINKKLSWGHIDISRDGKWLVARIVVPKEAFNKDPRSQIVKIDLKNYNVIPLTPVGGWAEYQRPKFSPSGKHILYKWQRKLEKGIPIDDVAVDGKKIYTAIGLSECSWINDNTIAFTSSINATEYNKREIIIIDSITGEIKGRHKID